MADHKIFTLDLPNDAPCTLVFEANETVAHYNDDYQEGALKNSGIFDQLVSLVTSPFFKNNRIITEMRDNNLLDDYERGSYEFESFICGKLFEEYWNYDFVETTLEQWDYKRGNFKMTARFETNLGQLKAALGDGYLAKVVLPSWEVQVQTPDGVLTVC